MISAARFDQHIVHKFRHVSVYCDLDLWPKVINFNRIRASFVNSHLAKTAFKSVHPVGWNRQTHRQTTDTPTNCSENITPPRFHEGVKRKKETQRFCGNVKIVKLIDLSEVWQANAFSILHFSQNRSFPNRQTGRYALEMFIPENISKYIYIN